MTQGNGDGNYFADAETLARIEGEGQVVFRYVDNPNGSVADIAGIQNARGNVLGMMPHPDRAFEAELGSADGATLFRVDLRGGLSPSGVPWTAAVAIDRSRLRRRPSSVADLDVLGVTTPPGSRWAASSRAPTPRPCSMARLASTSSVSKWGVSSGVLVGSVMGRSFVAGCAGEANAEPGGSD